LRHGCENTRALLNVSKEESAIRGKRALGRERPDPGDRTSIAEPVFGPQEREHFVRLPAVNRAASALRSCFFRTAPTYRRRPSLLYRRFPNLRAAQTPDAPLMATPCRFGDRRYSRFGNPRYGAVASRPSKRPVRRATLQPHPGSTPDQAFGDPW
jgi:hypothetical protein